MGVGRTWPGWRPPVGPSRRCTRWPRRRGRIELSTDHGPGVLPGVVALAGQAQIELTGVEVRSANLEDVFLSLTGKELRD